MMAAQELGAALDDTKKKQGSNNPEAASEFITEVNTMVNKFTEIMHQDKPYSIENAYTDFVTDYTWSRITRTCLYRIIAYFEGYLPHQKSLH